MATSAHTPGPWSVEVDDQSGIGRSHAVYICDARRWPEGQLARVNVQDGLGEREANARLFAAAPELLAALQGLVTSLAANDEDGLTELAEPMCGARAAIAKAASA